MRQKFFTNTIQSKFIKSLLKTSYLPNCNSCRDGDYLIKNKTYAYMDKLIRCTKSGFLNSYKYNSRISYTSNDLCEYDVISDYNLYEKSFNSRNFTSTVNYYDSLTHKNLGEFLRYKRDIEDLNLMPFYNCFCGNWSSLYSINNDFEIEYSNIEKHTTKCALIPVKFNRDYIISIESSTSIMISPVIIGDNGMLLKTQRNLQDIDLTKLVQTMPNCLVKYSNARFKYPLKYGLHTEFFEDEELISKYENSLYVLIQIDKNVDTSLSVIEGDFNTCFINYEMDFYYESAVNNNREFDKTCLSNLSLLKMNDGYSYPFADRLIEYLLLNVIDNRDSNPNNILIMQNTDTEYKGIKNVGGMYRDYYRRKIYKLMSDYYINQKNSIGFQIDDITGFVDKDVEKFLKKAGS